MAASDVRAGRAYIEIVARDNALTKGFAKASAQLKAFGASISGIGTKIFAAGSAISAGFGAAVAVFADLGDNIDETSQKLGISAESFSALSFAAEQTGGSVGSLSAAFKTMAKLTVSAANGGKEAAEAFAAIGLSAEEVVNLSPDQQFLEIADAISQIPNASERTAAALKFFGKGAQDLIPLLSGGRAGIEEFIREAERLGIVMDGETAAAAGKLNDSLAAIKTQIKFMVANIGGALAPAVQGIVDTIKEWASWVTKVIKANEGIFQAVAKVVLVVTGLGAGLSILGFALSGIGTLFGLMSGAIAGIGTILAAIGSAFAFLASPIGLVVAGLTGLTYWFLTATNTGKQVVSTLIAEFRQFAGEVTTSFGAIANAINAGEISAAWAVVTSLMNLKWVEFTSFLRSTWAEWKSYFMNIWADATAGFALVINDAFGAVQVGWAETVAFFQTGWVLIQKGWDEFTAVARLAWTRLFTWLAQGIAYLLEQLGLVEEGTVETVKQMAKDKAGEIMKDREEDQAKRNEQLGQIETNREKARSKIKEDAAGREQAILDQNNADRAANAKIEENTKGDAAKAVEDARKEWQAAIDAANAIEVGGVEEKAKQIETGAFEGAEEVTAKSNEARGTFNAAALQSLVGGDTQDKILEENKKQTALQKKIADNANGGAAFA